MFLVHAHRAVLLTAMVKHVQVMNVVEKFALGRPVKVLGVMGRLAEEQDVRVAVVQARHALDPTAKVMRFS